MYWTTLKINDPLANWLYTSVVTVLCGFYFIIAGVERHSTQEGIYITLNTFFWLGVSSYLIGLICFLYLKFAPRFKDRPAGDENLDRLRAFVKEYPEIADELSLVALLDKGTTFLQLKKIQKLANRKVIQIASKTLIKKV